MKLQIDSSLCRGHDRCYTLVTHMIEPDDDGFAIEGGAHGSTSAGSHRRRPGTERSLDIARELV